MEGQCNPHVNIRENVERDEIIETDFSIVHRWEEKLF